VEGTTLKEASYPAADLGDSRGSSGRFNSMGEVVETATLKWRDESGNERT